MQMDQMQQSINRIEECADQAKRAVQTGSVPDPVRQCVDTLHQQARVAKHGMQQNAQQGAAQQQGQEEAFKQQVMQLEQTGDKAMQAVRQAGTSIDQQTQQAIKRAHDEISGLKKQIQMG